MTQAEVVAKLQIRGLDISRSAFSQIEYGTLVALHQIFGVDYEAFFQGILD